MERKFEEIYKIDVNDKTEKKGNLTYLSWAFAWAEFKKIYPEATYEVKKINGLPYVKDAEVGFMVYTSVTADGLTYEMWLPVMDSKNHAILKPTMFEINKTIMRCLAKNLAMFGLGLYIYAGEDLPEDDSDKAKNAPKTANKSNVDKFPEKKKEMPQGAKGEAWRLTASELVTKYEVESAEKVFLYYEKALGDIPRTEWDEETTAIIREDLSKRQAQKVAKKRLESVDGDLPFKEVEE
ncbi:MAG: DUF1071 domain-containing protein [Clostridia bacterium]|nr:DUF1071 domain-containing protein [Clostridia bacterium]